MLYDPKWEKKTKADPLTVSGLIAWLETQRPETRYNYANSYDCLICQHLKANGFKRSDYGDFETATARVNIAAVRPWTFGAALARARAHAG